MRSFIRRRVAIYYRDSVNKNEPARLWLESLKDEVGRAAIYARILRAETGNFGDHKSIGGGVFEMRISVGPGYRLYYALDGHDVILLLFGGAKSTQSKDITKAKTYWKAHKLK